MKRLLYLLVIASLLMLVSPTTWTMAQDPAPEGDVTLTAEPPTAEPPTAEPPTAEPPTAEPPTAEPPTAEPPTAEPPTAEPTAEPTATPVPVTISHIAIRDAAEGYGVMVTTHTMKVGESLTLYAAAYDAEGNYLWDVPVNWSTTGTLAQAASDEATVEPAPEEAVEEPVAEEAATEEEVETEGVATEEAVTEEVATDEPEAAAPDTRTASFTFTPAAAGEGTIVADDGKGHVYETGLITVVDKPEEPEISHIAIRDAAEGLGSRVITTTLTVSDTLVVYAAAYDIEGNYLKDVPVNWMTTGTLDQIAATETISFTFTPVTPDTSGTITADGGEELTTETGVIDVIDLLMAAELERQALAGTWTTERIGVMNLGGPGTVASVVVNYYSSTGAQQVPNNAVSLNGERGAILGLPSQLANGRYSAVASSDQPIAVAAQNTNSTSRTSDMYAGFSAAQGATKLYFPLAYRNWSDTLTEKIAVQNVSGGDALVSLTYKVADFNMIPPALRGKEYTTSQVTIKPNAYHDFNLGDAFFNEANVTFGGVTVNSNVNVVAVASHVTQSSAFPTDTRRVYTQYGTAQTDALKGPEVVFPLVYKDWGGWRSGINVFDMSGAGATISLSCTGQDGNGNPVNVNPPSQTVGPNGIANFFMPSFLPAATRWYGSCKASTQGGTDVLGTISSIYHSLSGGGYFSYSSSALTPGLAASNLAVPLVYHNVFQSSAWRTGLQVYSYDTTRVTAHFLKDPSCTVSGWDSFTWDPGQDTPAGQSTNFFLPSYRNAQNQAVPNGWFGSVYVKATGNARTLASVSLTNIPFGAAGYYDAVGY